MIKHILVPIPVLDVAESAMGAAFILAEHYGAHAECLFVKATMAQILPTGAEGVAAAIHQEMAAELEREQEAEAKRARQVFDDLLEARHIDYRERSVPMELASASWRVVEGAAADVVASVAGVYDVTVAHAGPLAGGGAARLAIEAALFNTGRPVLVAPAHPPRAIGERVLIAWNNSPPAVRAIINAMPFLERAARVTVFSIVTGAKRGPSARDMADHLSWHGIKAEVTEVPPDDRPVGEALLAEAAARQSDLLVMGAYSHSRLREMILGGVSQHVLEHAELPVLMSH